MHCFLVFSAFACALAAVSPASDDETQSIAFPQEGGGENTLVSSPSGLHFNIGSSYKAVVTAHGVEVAGDVKANSVQSTNVDVTRITSSEGLVLDATSGHTFKRAGETQLKINPSGNIDIVGNVGIGTNAGPMKLVVKDSYTAAFQANIGGDTGSENSHGSQLLVMSPDDTSTVSGITLQTRSTGRSRWDILNVHRGDNFLGDLVFRGRSSSITSLEAMRVSPSGWVGIGGMDAWGKGPLTVGHQGEELFVVNSDGIVRNTQEHVKRATVLRSVSFAAGQTTTAVVTTKKAGLTSSSSGCLGGYIHARVEMSCYASAGSNAMLFESVVAGFAGHSLGGGGTAELPYHRKHDIINEAQNGNIELYNPSCREFGVKVTNNAATHGCVGPMTVTFTHYA